MNTPILLAGHSHVYSLGVPANKKDSNFLLCSLLHPTRLFQALAGPTSRDSRYWASLGIFGQSSVVALFWGGNEHLSHYLFATSEPFDLVNSTAPHLPVDPSVEIIPETVFIEQFFPKKSQALGELLTWLTGLNIRVIICGTPPPKNDDEFIRHHIRNELKGIKTYTKLHFNHETAHFTPPLIRYKLWLALQKGLSDTAKAHDLLFFPVPAITQDMHGFLRREYWSNDISHGNAAYGDIIKNELYEFIRQNS